MTKGNTMKHKILLITALVSGALFAHDDAGHKKETIEVSVDNDNGKIIKKVIMNGKELSAEEIKELEASGKLKTLHLDKSDMHGKHMKKMMVIDIDEDSADGKKFKIIKNLGGDKNIKKHWITSDSDVKTSVIKITLDDDGKETYVVDGKELSEKEIKEFKANDKFNISDIDISEHSDGKHKVIVMGADGKSDMDLHEFKVFKNHNGKDDKFTFNKKIIISSESDDPNRGRLGFMVNAKDDGWHVTRVVEKSGAQDAGIMKGDIIVKIGKNDLTKSNSSDKKVNMQTHKVGDKVKVKFKRDDDVLNVIVDAKALKSERIVDIDWNSEVDGDFDFSDFNSSMVFINKEGDFHLDEDDINIHLSDSLKDLNVFISDGKSTSTLLGKRHKFSSISDDLSKYFGTKDGVLVLSVDGENVFGLKDGDVIMKVNNNQVSSPKSIIKELLKADEQDKITLKIVRHKKNKTLKSN
jgi:hypothetical protein